MVRLPGLLPAERIDPARRAIQRALAQHGLWRDDARPPPIDAASPAAGRRKLPKGLARAKAVATALRTPALQHSVEALLGERPAQPPADTPAGRPARPSSIRHCRPLGPPALLLTLPNAETWTVPHGIWHLDLPRLPRPGIPGLQAFAFLDAVPPGGGGTLVVRGSHRLLNDRGFARSKQVKRLLKREPWFAALMGRGEPDRRRFLDAPAEVRGVPVQVVELHGEPGDVVLTDLRLLHTIAPNAGKAPRLMATQRYLRAEAAAQLAAAFGNRGSEQAGIETGSRKRRAGPSRTPAEGSSMRGAGPSRTPAEGSRGTGSVESCNA